MWLRRSYMYTHGSEVRHSQEEKKRFSLYFQILEIVVVRFFA